MSNDEILDEFFEMESFSVHGNQVTTKLAPERLRGVTLKHDIKIKNKVIVNAGRRVTARHVKILKDFR